MHRSSSDLDLELRFFRGAKAFLIEHIRRHADADGWCPIVASRLGPENGFGRTTLATTIGRLERRGVLEKRSVQGKGMVVRLSGWRAEDDAAGS